MPEHWKISSAKLRFFFQFLKRGRQELPKNIAEVRSDPGYENMAYVIYPGTGDCHDYQPGFCIMASLSCISFVGMG